VFVDEELTTKVEGSSCEESSRSEEICQAHDRRGVSKKIKVKE